MVLVCRIVRASNRQETPDQSNSLDGGDDPVDDYDMMQDFEPYIDDRELDVRPTATVTSPAKRRHTSRAIYGTPLFELFQGDNCISIFVVKSFRSNSYRYSHVYIRADGFGFCDFRGCTVLPSPNVCPHITLCREFLLLGEAPELCSLRQISEKVDIHAITGYVMANFRGNQVLENMIEVINRMLNSDKYIWYGRVVLLEKKTRDVSRTIIDDLLWKTWLFSVPNYSPFIRDVPATSPERFARIMVRVMQKQHTDHYTYHSSCNCDRSKGKCIHSLVAMMAIMKLDANAFCPSVGAEFDLSPYDCYWGEVPMEHTVSDDNDSVLSCVDTVEESTNESYEARCRRVVEYLQEKSPFVIKVHRDVMQNLYDPCMTVHDSLEKLAPHEKVCPYGCDNSMLVEKNARPVKVFTRDKKVADCMIVKKMCPSCELDIPYVEVDSGVFYAGDFLEIGFELDLMEDLALMWIDGQAVSDIINYRMSAPAGTSLPSVHDVRMSIEAFVSLLKPLPETYRLCPKCGPHPSVMVFDGNVKCRIKIPTSTIVNPLEVPSDETEFEELFGNEKRDRRMLEKDLGFPILRNFVMGTRARRYKPQPLIKTMSPFVIPEAGHSDGITQNTEAEKVRCKRVALENGREDVDENFVNETVNLLTSWGELRLDDLKDVARRLSIAGFSGLNMLALKKVIVEKLGKMTNKVQFVKILQNVTGYSGGVMFGMCCHGVVYCYKVMARGESGRDVFDLLVSMQYMPSVVYYDFASSLKTYFQRMSSPNPLVKYSLIFFDLVHLVVDMRRCLSLRSNFLLVWCCCYV